MTGKTYLSCLCVALLLCICGDLARAKFARPTYLPVDRLITNASAYVTEHPKDPHGYYVLGRIHYLAFANKAFEVGTTGTGDESPPKVAPDWLLGGHTAEELRQHAVDLTLKEFGYTTVQQVPEDERSRFWNQVSRKQQQLEEQNWQPESPPQHALIRHAAEAMTNFNKAIQLDPDNGLYYLGLASLLEQYGDFLRQKNSEDVPEEFRSLFLWRARELYYCSYELAIRNDLKHKYRPLAGLRSLVGYEAGRAYMRLLAADRSASEAEKRNSAAVQENLKKLEALQIRVITPIIFSLQAHSSLAELLAEDTRVRFDLDGDDVVELRPWVRPTTGILVWDPRRTGLITSGRQMFGSVTWWLFFADGYQALDVLDDDRDGTLAGPELAGISVWFDRDSDGISDTAEVLPIEQLAVVSVATKSCGHDNGSPMNEQGLELADGRTVATYDWIAGPAEALKNTNRACPAGQSNR